MVRQNIEGIVVPSVPIYSLRTGKTRRQSPVLFWSQGRAFSFMYFSFGMPHPVISHYRQPRRLKAARPSHRAMEGRFVSWDSPPRLDGMTGHAGEFPYCRCYPEPVIPKGDGTRKTFAPALPTQEQEKARGEKRLLTHWERSLGAEMIPHVPGTPLYNVEQAQFVPKKLTHYALDPSNERGKNKSRVFLSALGATVRHAADIERQVMAALPFTVARTSLVDQYGQHFQVEIPVTGPNGKTATVRTFWIYENLKNGGISTRPRLTSIYVK